MRLLQKLFGMTWLGDAFEDEEKDPREWFNGSFRYHDYEEIVDLYVKGSPISCAVSKDDDGRVYISFYSGDYETISYLTVKSMTTTNFVEEMGVHFCKFEFLTDESGKNLHVKTVTKKQFHDRVGDYALMLPYIKEREIFRNNFILVYHDWDVLTCTSVMPAKKESPVLAPGVIELLDSAVN